MLRRYKLFLFLFAWCFPCFLQGNEPSVCLCLIVKDDEDVIERCLNSVKDIVDCICICDAGSTDKTLNIINFFQEENQIPGKIYKQVWMNFAQNRTLSIRAAQKMLRTLGFSEEDTYLLILDPDMTVNVGKSFKKELLDKDSYLILEKTPSLGCYQYAERLLRSSILWKSIGIIDEVWTSQGPIQSEKLPSLSIDNMSSSESMEEELNANISLLQGALQKDPGNAHYQFYLAQSYKCLKKYDDAIAWYSKRIKSEGNKEEYWFSKYMLGDSFQQKGKWEEALYWYLEAFQTNPNRTEPLQKVASYYREKGQNDLAYIFAKHGVKIPVQQDRSLLDDVSLSHYQFDIDLSISAFYTRFKEDGFAAADHLVLTKNVPWYFKDNTYRNMLFYTQNLKNARYYPLSIDLPLIENSATEHYYPMNPSILKTKEGYQVILRSVNYTQTGAKIFTTLDVDGIFRTRNFLVSYDPAFNLQTQSEIVEFLPRERAPPCLVDGMEDCRIISFEDSYWFTCNTRDTNPNGMPQITLCKLAEQRARKFIEVERLTPLLGPNPNRCEKNWLPFVKDGAIHVIYSYDPFIIYKPDLVSGECKTVLSYTTNLDFSHFRGSAGPIEFDGGYLILVHETIHFHDYTRAYLHRFIYLDKDLKIKKLSKPFTFRHQGIEFCCSMTLDHSGKDLILPIGIEDHEAYLCFVDIETVKSLLDPYPIEINP